MTNQRTRKQLRKAAAIESAMRADYRALGYRAWHRALEAELRVTLKPRKS